MALTGFANVFLAAQVWCTIAMLEINNNISI
jgi:hypothetical protein